MHKKVHPKLPPLGRSRGAARCRRPRSCCCGRPPMKTKTTMKTIRPTTTAISSRCTTSLAHSLDQSPTPLAPLLLLPRRRLGKSRHLVTQKWSAHCRTTQCLKSPDSLWLSGHTGRVPFPASHIVDSASLSAISLGGALRELFKLDPAAPRKSSSSSSSAFASASTSPSSSSSTLPRSTSAHVETALLTEQTPGGFLAIFFYTKLQINLNLNQPKPYLLKYYKECGRHDTKQQFVKVK